jgi:hypothetical protein
VIAEVGPAVGAEHLDRALGERLRQAPQLGVEVALRREPRLDERAAPQPDLAMAVGILPVTNETLISAPSNRPARTSSSTMPPSAKTPTRSRLSTANPASLLIAVRSKPASAR